MSEDAGYGTKSVITHALITDAGLPLDSFTPVMVESSGRQEAVLKGLQDGVVDVMTFQEPTTSALMKTQMVSVLYDFNTKEGTAKGLGATYPAQSLLTSPAYIKSHPHAVQHLFNAMVKIMRFINTHTTAEVIAKLPSNYFDGKDRDAELAVMRATMQTFAKGDYAFAPESVRVVVNSIQRSDFDKSEEGQWRATGDKKAVVDANLYDNRFVDKAIREIR